MVPFEALYSRKCRTLLNWVEPSERRYYGIDFVEEVEKKSTDHSATHEGRPISSKELCRQEKKTT